MILRPGLNRQKHQIAYFTCLVEIRFGKTAMVELGAIAARDIRQRLCRGSAPDPSDAFSVRMDFKGRHPSDSAVFDRERGSFDKIAWF